MIHPFLEAGGILFWLVTAILFFVTVGFMSFHRRARAFVTVLAYIAGLVCFTDANVLGWLRVHWFEAIEYAVAYLAFGTLYMVFRWRMLSAQVKRVYADIRAQYLTDNKLREVTTPTDAKAILNMVNGQKAIRDLRVRVPLLVRENKARVTGWLAFWVFSLVEYVLGDLLVNLVDGIVHMFSGFMQNITNRHFAEFSELNN